MCTKFQVFIAFYLVNDFDTDKKQTNIPANIGITTVSEHHLYSRLTKKNETIKLPIRTEQQKQPKAT